MKDRNITSQITVATLILVVAILMLGCSKMERKEEKKSGITTTDTKKASQGRYLETDIPMPLEDGETMLDLIRTQDGIFELYSSKVEDQRTIHKAYRFDGSNWSEQAQFAAQILPEESTLSYAAYGKDGMLYVIYTDTDYKAHLVKLVAGGSMEELSVGIEDLAAFVNGLYVNEDGTVIIPVGDQVLIIDGSGTIADTLPQKNSYSNFCDSHTLTLHSFLTVANQGFVRYGIKNWNEEESIPFQNDETDIFGSLDAGSGDDFYLANTKGIHHMVDKGTIWETVVDGSLNSLGMPTTAIRRLFVGDNNDFYVWLDENEETKLVHYLYDPDMPSIPSITLTVYGLDLSNNLSIKQAASLFQMENPDIKVELLEGIGESGAIPKTDAIRSLNAELLNGSETDLLVLDGLPSDSYIEKGMLDDLSDILTPMVESDELDSNIAKSFTGSDGTIFQYPVRIILPVVYGDPNAIEGISTLETLKNWQEQNPDKAVFPKTIYENILRQLTYMYYPELKEASEGSLDKRKIQLLLETAKMVGDASGCQVKFDESEDGDGVYVDNIVSEEGFTGLGTYSMLKGMALASIEQVKGMNDMMIPYAMVEKYGLQLRQLNDIYYPNGLLGVLRSSKNKDAARKFLRFAISLKIQEDDLRDGFPVSKKAVNAWLKRTSDMIVSDSYTGTDKITAKYPDNQKKNDVMGMLNNLQTPVAIDDALLEMIINETKGYFEGMQSASEAAERFENKQKLFYAE